MPLCTQCPEDRGQSLDRFVLTADHEAVPHRQPPYPAAGSHVDIVDSLFLQVGCSVRIIVKASIAPIDDAIARLEQGGDGLHGFFGRDFRRYHDPDSTRYR